MLGLVPIMLNIVWLFLLTPTLKQTLVANDTATLAFYVVQAFLFCFFVGMTTFFLAESLAYDYAKMKYFWSVIEIMSAILLIGVSLLGALHSMSFTRLVYKFKKHMASVDKAQT